MMMMMIDWNVIYKILLTDIELRNPMVFRRPQCWQTDGKTDFFFFVKRFKQIEENNEIDSMT